jgi:hypothetical protein
VHEENIHKGGKTVHVVSLNIYTEACCKKEVGAAELAFPVPPHHHPIYQLSSGYSLCGFMD